MKNTVFYDRKWELGLLKEKYAETAKSQKGSMIALYGRRRVGKTELIKRFMKKVDTQKLYFYIGLSEKEGAFNALSAAIQEQTGDTIIIKDAEGFYKYILEKSRKGTLILVLDEFQRFLDIAPEMISSLQNHWDSILKNESIMIVLVGSSIGMMQRITDSRAGALYGRAQRIKLSPFKYADFRLMFEELSEEEKVVRYSVFGGTPFYLEKTKPFKDTFEAINGLILKKGSELSEEPKILLEYENVRVHAKYNSILQAISSGKEVLKEIQDFTKMPVSHLPPYINKLDKLLDLVKRNDPVLGKEKLGRYQIRDNFFRFWYKFVFPNETPLNMDNTKLVSDSIKENLNSYVGRVFEDVIKELLIMYNTKEIKGTKLNFENMGSWWDKNTNEIDVLAYNTKEKTYLLGEVKWTNKLLDSDVVEELLRKSKFINLEGKYQYLFVSKSGFTEKALTKIEELKGIHLDLKEVGELFDKTQ